MLAMGSFITPESPRSVRTLLLLEACADLRRYLIDTDQEVIGLQVIADFQGAPLDAPSVQDEYKEIRDAVLADVSRHSNVMDLLLMLRSVLSETGRTRHCGRGTRDE